MTEFQVVALSIAAYVVGTWVFWIAAEWRKSKREAQKADRRNRARKRVEERRNHAL